MQQILRNNHPRLPSVILLILAWTMAPVPLLQAQVSPGWIESESPDDGRAPFEDASGRMHEVVLDPQTKTIRLYREGWPLSYPVIRLRDDVPLVLEFDDLSEEQPPFLYRVIHCNADWTPSELTQQEYLEGYPENEITRNESSFSTYTSYRHFTLSLPNENTRFMVSGNYLLVVYKDWDPGRIAFTRRFMITENLVSIVARARIPVMNQFQGCCQEVEFLVNHQGVDIMDPFSECNAFVFQNGLWDMGIVNLKPFRVNENELVYESNEGYIFPGGNEYRFFDTKNTRTPSYYVHRIDYLAPYFHFELKPDLPNPPHNYFSKEDINGRYAIASDGGRDPGVDADYVFVHFTLNEPMELAGSVYLAGALTNWQFNELNRMTYSDGESAYKISLLLKQGVYNYRYLFLPEGADRFDSDEIEGSHSETENEYLILFYNRPAGARYDRLLGHQVIHSNQAP